MSTITVSVSGRVAIRAGFRLVIEGAWAILRRTSVTLELNAGDARWQEK